MIANKVDKPWLSVAGRDFCSRLLIGTEQYKSVEMLENVINASNIDTLIFTVDLRDDNNAGVPLSLVSQSVDIKKFNIIGTTSFTRTLDDALLVARMLRDGLGISIIKLDVRIDLTRPYPNNSDLIKGSEILLREGFYVMPFIIPDPVAAKYLENIGCSAIRLMASPIGRGEGISHAKLIREVLDEVSVPTIVEGGLGNASDVVLAMEMGADAVLVNTAIAQAKNPIEMARVISMGVETGRLSYLVNK